MKIKKRIRASIFPKLAYLFYHAGFSWKTVIRQFKQETVLAQVKTLEKEIIEIEKNEKPLKIVLFSYIAFISHLPVHYLLAKCLQKRGHTIEIIVLDEILPICELTDCFSDAKRSEIAGYYTYLGLKFWNSTNFKIHTSSSLINSSAREKIDQTSDFSKWKNYIQSMMLRYFKTGEIDEKCPKFKPYALRAGKSALFSEEIGKKILTLKPDRVVMGHGSYTTRGPAKDVILSAKIPIVSIERGKLSGTYVFNWNKAADDWGIDEVWKGKKDLIEFGEPQKLLIQRYLDSRKLHSADTLVYNFVGEEDKDKVMKQLKLDKKKKVYTLFSNVLWDAASAKKELVFADAREWIIETVQFFIQHPEIQLIIRTHPAEKIINTNLSVSGIIKSFFAEMPDNICLLEADTPINSWSILKVTDVGIVHTSTVGLELALEGKPCICVANTHYRGKNMTIDVLEKGEYFSKLSEKKLNFDGDKAKYIALEYAYAFFLKYHLPFPFLIPRVGLGIKYIREDNLFKIINSPYSTQIIKSIETQTPFLSSDELLFQFHHSLIN